MKFAGWAIVTVGVAGLFWMVWRDQFAAPSGHLYGMADAAGEAAYCLAVAERIAEITGGRADARLRVHLDEQIGFWRARAGPRPGLGRAMLGRATAGPGVNEGAHLHLAVQDCALRAISFYGHRFAGFD